MAQKHEAAIKRELEALRKKHGGDLNPNDVAIFARDHANSALHKYGGYKWVLSEAAFDSWVNRSRQLIRMYVEILDVGDDEPVPTRAYVNLSLHSNEHYRSTEEVLSEEETRNELVLQLLDNARSGLESYPLPEIKPLLAHIEEIRETILARKKKKSKGKKKRRDDDRPEART